MTTSRRSARATRPASSTASPRSAWRRAVGLALAGLLAATLPALGDGARAATAAAATTSDLTMVQANIYTRLGNTKFTKDVRKVMAQQPDFVTYNEVPFRSDASLTPEGYALYRGYRNRFTKATPVAWRTDRWTKIDSGTFRISNWRGKPPGRVVELGRRFANWVTLRGVDGRVLSVVSIHVAPKVKGMPDLRRRSVARLGVLVGTLRSAGPVLVGGDFNIHYKSGIYPRDLLTAAGLEPTYDTLQAYFPTGDHMNMTIDYVFNRGADQLEAVSQRPIELNSDHDAVVAGFDWQVDPPGDTTSVTSDPAGDPASQRAAVRPFAQGLRTAPAGAVVELATNRFDLPVLLIQIRRALARGVHVRATINGTGNTVRQRRLERAILASGDPQSSFSMCDSACAAEWKATGVPLGLMMVSNPDGDWIVRYDMSRRLTQAAMLFPTTTTTYVGPLGLAGGDRMLRSIS
jgi:endonuclease/exonuclease/phosphatase (EEP) superfamily protein YafD